MIETPVNFVFLVYSNVTTYMPLKSYKLDYNSETALHEYIHKNTWKLKTMQAIYNNNK